MTKTPTWTREAVAKMSNAELVAVYQAVTGKSTRRFASYAKGQAQVLRALEAAGRLVEAKPAKPTSLADRLFSIMRTGEAYRVDMLALAMECTETQVRGALGALRARGHQTFNTGPGEFRIAVERAEGGHVRAGERYTAAEGGR